MTYEENYLAHFGIKGQKWGIRRFQNEDGTLTAAGKERYGHNYSEIQNNYQKAVKNTVQAYKNKAEAKGLINKTKAKIALFNTKKKLRDITNVYEKAQKQEPEKHSAEMEAAKERGLAKSKEDISRIESLSDDKESDKVKTEFLKEMHDYIKEEARERAAARSGLALKIDEDRDPDSFEKYYRMGERYEYMAKRVQDKSVDWYQGEGHPKSDAAKEICDLIKKNNNIKETIIDKFYNSEKTFSKAQKKMQEDPAYIECEKIDKNYMNQLMGIVLKDIGFPDTEENREYIKNVVFYYDY